MAYPSDFVIIILDKTTTNVINWHQIDTQIVLDTRLVLEVLRYFTIYGYSTKFAILRVLLTVNHGDFNLLSDVTSSCTVAAYN